MLGTAASLAVASLVLTGCGGDSEGASADGGEPVTLNFTWWGNEDRAKRYQEAMSIFEEKNPNIEVNGTFMDFPAYWQKRQTEAAGGGLPDVMQFDYSYLRQYAQNGLLLELDEYAGSTLTLDSIDDTLLATGQLEGTTYALPTGYNAWSAYENSELVKKVGAEPYKGGTSWEEYEAYMAEVSEASGGKVYGGVDYTQRIQNFELKLRQEGKQLFTEDGQLGFTQERLAEFWKSGEDIRENGAAAPARKLEAIAPKSGLGAKVTTSELGWSNFLPGYLADTGLETMTMVAPPTSNPSADDLYLKPSLMHAVSSSTEHPEAAVKFVEFLINSEENANIFGGTLGIPASETALQAANLEGPDLVVKEYLESIEDRLGEPPAAPVAGYGALEDRFLTLGGSIGLGEITPEKAAEQFFDEAAVALEG